MRKRIHLAPITLTLALLWSYCLPTTGQSASVLSSGQLYKIPILEDGVYALTQTYLQGLGINTNTLNPQQLHLFGYGGGMLPQALSSPRYEDLPQLAVQGVGLTDGSFDANDRLLFYAQGPHNTTYRTEQRLYSHELNLYSDTAYVFLKIADIPPIQVTTRANESPSNPTQLTWFPDVAWVEREQTNRDQSGRQWYENPLESGTRRDYVLNTPNRITQDSLHLRVGVMIHSYATAPIATYLGETLLGTITTPNSISGTYQQKGWEGSASYAMAASGLAGSDETTVGLQFTAASSSVSTGYPNYLTLTYPRRLRARPDLSPWLWFHSYHRAGTASTVLLENATGYTIWETTNPTSPKRITTSTSQGNHSFSLENTEGHTFVAFLPNDVPTPTQGYHIGNQDLSTWNNPELVIVSHPDFLPAAHRLAAFRRNWDGLRVRVVSTEAVYNQFASGQPDVSAIRNMAKYVWDNTPDFKYLLLIGKGTYDYKHLETNQPDQNFLPIYESRNSLHPLLTFGSDDYYGFLEDEEGLWVESSSGNHTLDIGVGRLPVITLEEAQTAVDKLIHYSQSTRTFGDWRQRLVFLADDGDTNQHLRDAERITGYLDTAEAHFQIRKLYLDAFEQIPLGSLQDAPAARQALNESLYRGSLILNYTGHGNEFAWAEEGFFKESLIEQWDNLDQLPLFITATCEFGRHDSGRRRSGAEKILLHERGGGIALLTTARPVYSSSNFLVNRVFYQQAFYPEPNGESPRLGDIIRRTKNRSTDNVYNRNFVLLGDPSLRLALPQYQAVVTTVNQQPVDTIRDTLRALREIVITGQIQDALQQPVTEFNGTLTATLYDNAQSATTLGNQPENIATAYQVRNNLLFRGQVSVVEGAFTVRFKLPRNIDYSAEVGRLHLYAYDSALARDAQGVNQDLVITGSEVHSVDLIAPEVTLYMNDTTFVPHGVTHPDPVLVAHLFDASGINLSQTQLGQSLQAQIDGGAPFLLSDYYTSRKDRYGEGEIAYPLFDLEEGHHTVTLTAYDVYNNGTVASLPFVVSTRGDLALEEVFNYPNPFERSTTFRFVHNRAGDPLQVQVDIYNAMGAFVHSLSWEVDESTNLVDGLTWEGTDAHGQPLRSGLYVYRITVKSLLDEVHTETIQQFVVIK